MHIILNVDSLVKPSGGIGCYTKHLLAGFVESDDIDRVSCFVSDHLMDGAEFLKHLDSHRSSSSRESSGVKNRVRQLVRLFPFASPVYAAYREAVFNYRTKSYVNALYHEPNFILKPFKGLCVPTIHDISHIHFPQYHPKKRVDFMAKNFSETLSRASHILTDSNFVRNELIQLLNIEEERVTSIPLGVDARFHPRSENELLPVLSQYQLLPGQYLLSVATLEPRKNISMILDAYMQLDKSIRLKYPLVLVGGRGWKNNAIKNKIKALEMSGDVMHIGYVSSNDLSYIVAGARSFIFIPFYEGFGLPPLEAMASGVPVLTSNVSSLPEVVGDAGIMVEPDDEKNIIRNLETVLIDELSRKNMITEGLERSTLFTWDNCVEQTIQIYKKCQL